MNKMIPRHTVVCFSKEKNLESSQSLERHITYTEKKRKMTADFFSETMREGYYIFKVQKEKSST